MIVLIGGEKGGTGKTTLTVNLACMAAADGADLMVVDTDVQRSAAKFFGVRAEEEIEPYVTCIEKGGRSLGKDLLNLAKKYELVIVDAGGQDSLEFRLALLVADEAYTPVQPNQFDLWTLGKMNSLVDEAHLSNTKLQAHTVLNRCSSNPRNTDSQETRELLETYKSIPPLKTEIKERVVYPRVVRAGRCVTESGGKNNAAALEIKRLYEEMFDA